MPAIFNAIRSVFPNFGGGAPGKQSKWPDRFVGKARASQFLLFQGEPTPTFDEYVRRKIEFERKFNLSTHNNKGWIEGLKYAYEASYCSWNGFRVGHVAQITVKSLDFDRELITITNTSLKQSGGAVPPRGAVFSSGAGIFLDKVGGYSGDFLGTAPVMSDRGDLSFQDVGYRFRFSFYQDCFDMHMDSRSGNIVGIRLSTVP